MLTYDVVNIDLSVAHPAGQPLEVSPRGTQVDSISVLALPAGAAGLVNLRIGISNPGIPLTAQGMELAGGPCEALEDGVYFDNPVLAGILTLYIGRVGAPAVVSPA